jgi:hypothetical protein
MGKAGRAMELISSQIATVSQDCFTQASNIFKMNLKAEDTVNLSNINVTSDSTTHIASCSATTGIEQGIMHKQLDRALDQLQPTESDGSVLDAFSSFNGYTRRINMRSIIRDSITVDIVNRCLAVSMNAAIFEFNNAKNINISNLDVTQTAKSTISECVSNADIKIGNTTQSLMQFLERNEDQYNVEGYDCNGFETAKNTLAFGTIAFSLALLAVIGYVVISRLLQRKKLRKTSPKKK